MDMPGRRLSSLEWLESGALTRIGRQVTFRYGLTASEGDDLIQELKFRVWRAGAEKQFNSSWVFRAAEHLASDIKKANHRQRALQTREHGRDPDAGQAELVSLSRAHVSRLPATERLACELYLLGHSEREIALQLCISRAALRKINEWCRRGRTARRRS